MRYHKMTAADVLASEPLCEEPLTDCDGDRLAGSALVTLNESNEYCIGWPPDGEEDLDAWAEEREWLPFASA